MAPKIVAAAVTALLLAASSLPGETGKGKPSSGAAGGSADRKDVRRLDEVRIQGSVEHPGVLFFLPKAKFRLLPIRNGDGRRWTIPPGVVDKGEVSE